MLIVTLVLVFLIVGLLMYALSTNPKLVEIGRLMFFAAVLAFLLSADKIVTLGH